MRTRTGVVGAVCVVGVVGTIGCGAHRGAAYDGEDEVIALSGTAAVQAVHSGLCASVADANLGTQLLQEPCNGQDDRRWTLRSVGTNTFNLVNAKTGLCM